MPPKRAKNVNKKSGTEEESNDIIVIEEELPRKTRGRVRPTETEKKAEESAGNPNGVDKEEIEIIDEKVDVETASTDEIQNDVIEEPVQRETRGRKIGKKIATENNEESNRKKAGSARKGRGRKPNKKPTEVVDNEAKEDEIENDKESITEVQGRKGAKKNQQNAGNSRASRENKRNPKGRIEIEYCGIKKGPPRKLKFPVPSDVVKHIENAI